MSLRLRRSNLFFATSSVAPAVRIALCPGLVMVMKRRDLFKAAAAAAALPLVIPGSAAYAMSGLPTGTVIRGLWIGDYNREAFRAAHAALIDGVPKLLLLDFEECGLGASELLAAVSAVARDSHGIPVDYRSVEERSPHWSARKIPSSGPLVVDGVELDAGRWPGLSIFLQQESALRPVIIAGCDSSGWMRDLRARLPAHDYVLVPRPDIPELVALLQYCLDPSGTRLTSEALSGLAAGSRPFHAIFAAANRHVFR